MSEREKKELFDRLENASNKEIGQFVKQVSGKDPFEGSLLLPSVIRKQAIDAIKDLVNKGNFHLKKQS